MPIKKVFIISFIIGLLIPIFTHAQIRITEIMYDPAGSDTKREWVEIYNESSQDIDLSTWFLHENNVFHKFVTQKGSVLPAGSYAIIADSISEVLADYVDYIGLIFDSVFSLNNTGETISIANSQKQLIDTFTYQAQMGGNNTGQSLQVNEGIPITAGPTFGTLNKTETEILQNQDNSTNSTSTTTGSGSSSNDSTHTEQVSVSNYIPASPFRIGAGRDRTASINTVVDFEAYLSKPDIRPGYRWNFGDFSTDTGRKVEHIYSNSGTYQVVLEGKEDGYTAISRTEVHIIEPQLVFKRSTSTIGISNMSKQEINLGYFVLNFNKGKLSIPRNTILSDGATLNIPVATSTIIQSFEYPNGEIYQQFDTMYEVIP